MLIGNAYRCEKILGVKRVRVRPTYLCMLINIRRYVTSKFFEYFQTFILFFDLFFWCPSLKVLFSEQFITHKIWTIFPELQFIEFVAEVCQDHDFFLFLRIFKEWVKKVNCLEECVERKPTKTWTSQNVDRKGS